MTVGTVHGRVQWKPTLPIFDLLQEQAIATASQLFLAFPAGVGNYNKLVIEVTEIQKPSAATTQLWLQISTNGATAESAVSAYDFVVTRFTATTALTATGTISAQQFPMNFTGGFSLATATSRGGVGELSIDIPGIAAQTGRDPRLIAEHHFLNSASSPAVVQLWGMFASGPILGLAINTGGTDTISLYARVYGVGRGW